MRPCRERKETGCTESEKLQPLLVVHACARLATPQLGPHLATGCSSEIAKAADACSTLGDTEESYTEFCEVDTLEGKGEIFSVLM
jgi:hypothetical protein